MLRVDGEGCVLVGFFCMEVRKTQGVRFPTMASFLQYA